MNYNSRTSFNAEVNNGTGIPLLVQVPRHGKNHKFRVFEKRDSLGSWQSKADLQKRRRMVVSVLMILKKMKSNKDDDIVVDQNLAMAARKLEQYLYQCAKTREEYMDKSTLKKRLLILAQGMEVYQSQSKFSNIEICTEIHSENKVPPKRRHRDLWQTAADEKDRRLFCDSIVDLLKKITPPEQQRKSQRLHEMALKLEEYLYRSALSKKEYLDRSTLKKRIQLVSKALRVHRSNRSRV